MSLAQAMHFFFFLEGVGGQAMLQRQASSLLLLKIPGHRPLLSRFYRSGRRAEHDNDHRVIKNRNKALDDRLWPVVVAFAETVSSQSVLLACFPAAEKAGRAASPPPLHMGN